MQYMLLIYNQTPERVPSEAEFGAVRAEYGTYTEDIRKRGAMVDGSALARPTSATTVRVREGNRVVTDGPFAETKESLGGYYLIEAADLDAAIAVAKQVPARFGGVEVRPIMVFE
jgi:hypothetical protein